MNKNPIQRFRCEGDETDIPPSEFFEVRKLHRGKTGVSEIVTIMPIHDEIIAIYDTHPCHKVFGRLLPIKSNTRYKGYLKEIAAIC